MPSPAVSVEAREAQKLHGFLVANSLFEASLKPKKIGSKVFFPVKKITKELLAEMKTVSRSAEKCSAKFSENALKPRSLKDALAGKLSEKLLSFVQSSFDSLGDAAIIEVPEELKGKEKIIGLALMETNKSIESVYMKTGAHEGIFRVEPVKLIAGKKKKFATYKEHGCTFRISMGKVFFSPRLSTERKRISALIKEGEVVAALFAGAGPFPIVFAKNSKMEKAIAIELNPVAVEDMRQNIALNKVTGRVEPVSGDVKALAEKYAGTCDRAVMPLPKGGEDFLADAIKYIRPSGGVVHYYQFVSRENPFGAPLKQIAEACKKLGRKFRVLVKRKVREYSPDTIQVVIDFEVKAPQ